MKRFLTNEAGTEVTDSLTGLVWSQNTVASDVNHADAVKAVEAMGEGWRLPTVDELQTIVDRTKCSPAIDADVFPDTENDWYWTSTEYAWNKSARWVVNFNLGLVLGYHDDYLACVRAVRASQ